MIEQHFRSDYRYRRVARKLHVWRITQFTCDIWTHSFKCYVSHIITCSGCVSIFPRFFKKKFLHVIHLHSRDFFFYALFMDLHLFIIQIIYLFVSLLTLLLNVHIWFYLCGLLHDFIFICFLKHYLLSRDFTHYTFILFFFYTHNSFIFMSFSRRLLSCVIFTH